jgi:Rps23 Pro-64 3,4-dihydroxylase Tpa1-like proline 4-hydroxylase
MSRTPCLDLFSLTSDSEPFAHFWANGAFDNQMELDMLDWLKSTRNWQLTETDFYEQYEFSLLSSELPTHLKCLISEETIQYIERRFEEIFQIESLSLVGVVAHKLVENHRIGIHNDFINGEETHRLIIQINSGWKEENGGYLMLFSSSEVKDVAKIIIPFSNSVVGFEISERSYHAVSKIYNFSRYTIVYTFKAIRNERH